MRGQRIYQRDVDSFRERLSPRDLAVLDQVRDLRLMSGAQIQAVHFNTPDHETHDAALRACRRVLHRLVRERLLVRLQRRVGGLRGGSSSFIYAASPLGYRVLDGDGPRRRFKEPSATFVRHTLSVGQLVVDLIDRQRSKELDIIRLEPEPRCWRRYSAIGNEDVLRPDLFVALGVGEYEHHSFVEVDLGTETFVRRLAKCRQYESYYRSGEEQAAHDLFPKVLWVMTTIDAADEMRRRIAHARGLTTEIFGVTTHAEALSALTGGTS